MSVTRCDHVLMLHVSTSGNIMVSWVNYLVVSVDTIENTEDDDETSDTFANNISDYHKHHKHLPDRKVINNI